MQIPCSCHQSRYREEEDHGNRKAHTVNGDDRCPLFGRDQFIQSCRCDRIDQRVDITRHKKCCDRYHQPVSTYKSILIPIAKETIYFTFFPNRCKIFSLCKAPRQEQIPVTSIKMLICILRRPASAKYCCP